MRSKCQPSHLLHLCDVVYPGIIVGLIREVKTTIRKVSLGQDGLLCPAGLVMYLKSLMSPKHFIKLVQGRHTGQPCRVEDSQGSP